MPTFVFSDICFARKRSHALCFYKGADSRSFCVYHKCFVLGKFSFFPNFTRIIANKAEITRLPVSPLRSRKVIGSNSTSGTVCTSHLFTTWQVHHPFITLLSIVQNLRQMEAPLNQINQPAIRTTLSCAFRHD